VIASDVANALRHAPPMHYLLNMVFTPRLKDNPQKNNNG
jgi:hypothetical protein